MINSMVNLTLKSDVDGLTALLNTSTDSVATVKACKNAMDSLYWERKDLPATILLAEAGIAYGMGRARLKEELRVQLLKHVKTLAYNLGSFTWPGWDEPGIDISPEHLQIGLRAAELNLRLSIELERGLLAESRAHWLLGAQHMAVGAYKVCFGAFLRAEEMATQARCEPEALLADGYLQLAHMMDNPQNSVAKDRFHEICATLATRPDGHEFSTQLMTAHDVFFDV